VDTKERKGGQGVLFEQIKMGGERIGVDKQCSIVVQWELQSMGKKALCGGEENYDG